VADSGCGITPETKSRLFEPFFSTKFSGRGLGLTAVLGIVRSHAGTIEVSGEPGRGTTVTVLFPPAPETKLPAPAAIAALPALAGRATVLVVDDDEAVRALAKASLLRAGLRVLLAADGYEALRILREDSEEVTVVLLDLMMPNLDGGEVLRRLRASHPDLPVILTTGYHQQEVLSEELKAGSVGFLPKPFRPKDLLDRIAAVCAGETTPVQTNGLRR
jgi:CheY-like chemotaxis protein